MLNGQQQIAGRDSKMRRLVAVAAFTASFGLAVAWPATAGAAPVCPKTNVVIVQGKTLPSPGDQVCDDDPGGDGLLGNAPVVGNLPGLGGVL
ncbi:MAG: hypothetical protein QOD39_5252 [Mycobacterium sp.]|jgi:hypothetical protein|nr:hypothetical protein [Mycobacterium sp.]